MTSATEEDERIAAAAFERLCGAMGKAFLPYLPHLEKLDLNSMPRNIRKWCEILTDLANDVKARQADAEPRIIE